MPDADLLVVGGGPAGAATAWRARVAGLAVVVLDKATFPRNKPCGDGITPRGVKVMTDMGLSRQLSRYRKIHRVRAIGRGRVVERTWPSRGDGLPNFCYVIPRTELDEFVLGHAQDAGVKVREGTEVLAPIVEAGQVRGVRARQNGREFDLRAPITVAADGMSSRVARAVSMTPAGDRDLYGISVRAECDIDRDDEPALELYELRHEGRLVPGYGWVFPTGPGRANVGIGYLSSYTRWRSLNMQKLFGEFLGSLPAGWRLPSVSDLVRGRDLAGWRLPLGLAAWPPWRPGLLAVGDAAGVASPFTGAGISKALQSGLIAAEEAVNALANGSPADLRSYAHNLDRVWGSQYQKGRALVRVIGRPGAMEVLLRVMMRYQDLQAARHRSPVSADVPAPVAVGDVRV